MIHVIWPTIRPVVAVKRATEWVLRSSTPTEFHFGVNTIEHADLLDKQSGNFNRSTVTIPDVPTGVTATAIELTEASMQYMTDGDAVVLASDDFEAHAGWDKTVAEECARHPGPIIFNDAYAHGTNIIPIPVVSFELLKKLNGILYHPAYHHFFSDQELFDVFMGMGNVKNLRGVGPVTFTHKHWSFGGRDRDEFDVRNTQKWDQDKATYEKRKSLPLAEKLKL